MFMIIKKNTVFTRCAQRSALIIKWRNYAPFSIYYFRYCIVYNRCVWIEIQHTQNKTKIQTNILHKCIVRQKHRSTESMSILFGHWTQQFWTQVFRFVRSNWILYFVFFIPFVWRKSLAENVFTPCVCQIKFMAKLRREKNTVCTMYLHLIYTECNAVYVLVHCAATASTEMPNVIISHDTFR